MSSVKQAAQAVLDHLPDNATWDELMYELYVKQKIEQGFADVDAGRTIAHQQLKDDLLGDAH